MDQYQTKEVFRTLATMQPNPGIVTGSVGCERPQTAVETLTDHHRSNNSSLMELEMRLHTILARIGHSQASADDNAKNPPTSPGTFHQLADAVQGTASISGRLHKLVSALETYI